MARTQIATGHKLAPIIVQRQLFLEQKKAAYFSKFFSASGDMPVFEKSDFTKAKGETMTFGLITRVTGSPITGNATVKGKEDKLTTYSFSMTLDRYRYAIMDDGALTRQRFVGDIPSEIKSALTVWGAEEIDKQCMAALVASPTNIQYGGDATGITTDLDTADKMTPQLISKVKAIALTQRGSGKSPLRPVMVDGKKYLVLLISPDVAVDLKYDTTFMAAQKDAAERGSNNPLFTGMLGIWDGVVIHEHENVPIFSNGGSSSNVKYSKCTLMGASALCWAWGERPSIVEEDEDYGEFKGYCWRMTSKVAKPVFNNNDYGSIQVIVADSRATGRTVNLA
jgi:N4-gp56 family major capsid protein